MEVLFTGTLMLEIIKPGLITSSSTSYCAYCAVPNVGHFLTSLSLFFQRFYTSPALGLLMDSAIRALFSRLVDTFGSSAYSMMARSHAAKTS